MADSTLQAIKTKVRRITRSPSESQITDAQLNEYVNTFILYDFPSNIRLFNLRTTVEFYTTPYVDTYETTTTNPDDPLYNFKNRYMAIHPPAFIAGVQAMYTQQRDVFYGYWPQTNTIATIATGDGATSNFTGIIQGHPMLQNSVVFSATDFNGNDLLLVDNPSTVGPLVGDLIIPNDATASFGTINYVTGAYSFNFVETPADQTPVTVTNIAYQPGKSMSILYYADQFKIRPVPDKAYVVQLEVDIRPTELLNNGSVPELEQWWQYIALGAAIKVFQDRMDMDSVQLIMPEYRRQENMVLRTTLTQQANERTVTIYTQGKSFGFGYFGSAGWPY